jgi:hypothetical protein
MERPVKIETAGSIGGILAIIILIVAIGLMVVGKMPLQVGLLIAGLAVARLS